MLLSDIFLQEMTAGEVSYLQREMDKLFAPLHYKVIITQHVLDRVNNKNGRESSVSPTEILDAFTKAIKNHKKSFELCITHKQNVEVVLHDKETKLNIPFKIDGINQDKNGKYVIGLITIMRKDPSKFKSYGYEMNV